METKASSKSVILNYGLYLGVISVLINVIIYASLDLVGLIENQWMVGTAGFVAMIVLITLGIKKFKTDNLNILSFGQGVKVGVGIAIISALISIAYNLIFINLIEPGFQDQVMEVQRRAWEDANMTSDQIQAAEDMAKTFSGPAISAAFGIIVAAFLGFVISAIGSAIMKRSEEDGY